MREQREEKTMRTHHIPQDIRSLYYERDDEPEEASPSGPVRYECRCCGADLGQYHKELPGEPTVEIIDGPCSDACAAAEAAHIAEGIAAYDEAMKEEYERLSAEEAEWQDREERHTRFNWAWAALYHDTSKTYCGRCGEPKVAGEKCNGEGGCDEECCEGWSGHCCRCGTDYALGQLPW
jgi:hypothetical protein